jgi:uncharacterized membrane protein YeaQ/YmgE (transglycosylase-associated protein family)
METAAPQMSSRRCFDSRAFSLTHGRLLACVFFVYPQEFDKLGSRALRSVQARWRSRLGEGGLGMGVISWIILGLIAGFIASRIVNKTGSGMILDIVLGIVGAIVGGFIFSGLFGMSGVTGVNIWSIIVSVVGAVIVLWIYHALVERA